MNLRPLTAALLCLALGGCAVAPSRTPSAATPADAGADANLNAVAWTQTAAEHDMIYIQTWRAAQDQLLAALRNPTWDALAAGDRVAALGHLPAAVIVDVDETVLDNSPYQARLLRDGKAYASASWAAWCREQRARATPGAVAFAQFAQRHGVTMIYLSNRDQSLDTVTLANLRKVGLPVAGPQVFLGLGTAVPGCTPTKPSAKSCRRQAVSRHYRVLLQVGDQLGDFVDPPQATLAGHRQVAERYRSWLGNRWFVLPNPTYGAWETLLSAGQTGPGAAAQRQAKLAKLRYDED